MRIHDAAEEANGRVGVEKAGGGRDKGGTVGGGAEGETGAETAAMLASGESQPAESEALTTRTHASGVSVYLRRNEHSASLTQPGHGRTTRNRQARRARGDTCIVRVLVLQVQTLKMISQQIKNTLIARVQKCGLAPPRDITGVHNWPRTKKAREGCGCKETGMNRLQTSQNRLPHSPNAHRPLPGRSIQRRHPQAQNKEQVCFVLVAYSGGPKCIWQKYSSGAARS